MSSDEVTFDDETPSMVCPVHIGDRTRVSDQIETALKSHRMVSDGYVLELSGEDGNGGASVRKFVRPF